MWAKKEDSMVTYGSPDVELQEGGVQVIPNLFYLIAKKEEMWRRNFSGCCHEEYLFPGVSLFRNLSQMLRAN